MVCSRYPKEYKHYETVLKRKCFKKLRNNVWESKTKWVLTEKADNHYRIKLLYKCINLWVVYLNLCYKKKINRRAAEVFYEEKLKSKGIAVLKKNVQQTWLLLRICKEKFEWNLQYRSWHQWKHYVQKRLKVREIKVLGDRIREERLRIKYFYLWLFRWNEKRSFQEAYETATARFFKKLKEKYFKIWKNFTSKKICEKQIGNFAVACYKDKLKEKCIRCWRKYTYQKKRYRCQMSVIQNFYENFLIKNYLTQWFIFYKRFKRERKNFKNNLALNFHSKKTLERSFKMLRKAREMRKAREEAAEKFRDIYMKIYLNIWIGRRTEKIIWNILQEKAIKLREEYLTDVYLTLIFQKYQERVEDKEKLENVINYCNAIIIHRAFQEWREVVKMKINKKIQLENISKLYVERIKKKSFEKWQKFVGRRYRKKMTADYYKRKLLSRAMYSWKISLSETKLKIEKAKDLEQKLARKLLQKLFECWKENSKFSKIKLNTAIDFCNNSRLTKAFGTWKKNTRARAIHKNRYNRNLTILNYFIIKSALNRLFEVYLVRQSNKKILQKFKTTQEKRLLGSYFNIWRIVVQKKKTLEQNLNLYLQLRTNVLTEQYLIILFEKMKSNKAFNMKNESARTFEEKLLKRKYLKRWLSFISWKKKNVLWCRAKEKSMSFEEAVKIIVPVGKTMRRKPRIPDYLKSAFSFEEFQDVDPVNQETFRIEQPVNKKLPIIERSETLALY